MSFFGSGSGLAMPPVVKNIIIINVILFAGTFLTTDVFNSDFMWRHLALFSVKSPLFEPHQVITHIFMHANFAHIFFNMFGVFMFGRILEQLWGSKKMLIFYTVTGLGAAFIHLTVNYIQMNSMLNLANEFSSAPSYTLFHEIVTRFGSRTGNYDQIMSFMQQWFYKPDDLSFIETGRGYVSEILYGNLNIPTVGASGAVFGLLIAFAMMFPDAELMLIFLPIPIKAKYFVPFYALLELFFGVAGFQWDNVAHFAHLGGALFGFLMVKYWKRNQFRIN
ncbi:MAG: rhomboid family intramembrane serine protease [Bacteroidales bacterium]|nr:rhomboid family intramembrane serine protease [Bacteroidales bacterium]